MIEEPIALYVLPSISRLTSRLYSMHCRLFPSYKPLALYALPSISRLTSRLYSMHCRLFPSDKPLALYALPSISVRQAAFTLCTAVYLSEKVVFTICTTVFFRQTSRIRTP
ncbi:hypothetical protein CHS0354_003766 [Potamilus streckersoni]|uniref:Uncharacterized protein n=1 Tax=Potamilus streckersoni TaxID=2493646 RepID=A0AAE0RQI5_9BIVA|nr:hypothetical protein CHS0354_003766 [Potamilus streckersoni]